MSFVLSHEIVGEERAANVVYVLHGVLGSGQNFRGFVRQLKARRPEMSYVLVDLRNHGGSTPAPPPHTLTSCAADILKLSEHLEALGMSKPVAFVGHSFGGKVALRAAELLDWSPDKQVFLLDSDPGSTVPEEDDEVLRVIRAVRRVPMPAGARGDVVQALRGYGLSTGLANWMTTNLRRDEGRYRWVFDLDAIEVLLNDYFAVDLWPYIERPQAGPEVHFVVAERSERYTPNVRQRATKIASESASALFHIIENAGHWLHVDNPAALLELLSRYLRKAA